MLCDPLIEQRSVALSIDAVSSSCSPVDRNSLASRSQLARESLASSLKASCKQLANHSQDVSNSLPSRCWEDRKSTPGGTKMDPQRVQNRAKIPQGRSKSAQERPRAAQECPKSGPRAAKSAQRAAKSNKNTLPFICFYAGSMKQTFFG